ncbi:unnamed protein product [Mytilus edulis]|uniref:Uncharacterized protein n=1 Tax=Mytilus edulis TaxID=6550 RepID=A0A8S3VEG9_MYTED|nr:unnamed protein product [Mytilus edulis]
MTRNLCMSVCQRNTWDSYFEISTQVKTELEFWKSNCKSIPNLLVCPIHKIPERIIFSDASMYAGAGFVDGNVLQIAHYMFSEQERLKSSTWRELKSVEFILEMCNPCEDKLIQMMIEGAKRILSKPVLKKEPITADHLQKIVDKIGSDRAHLPNVRICAMMLVGYAGFLRYMITRVLTQPRRSKYLYRKWDKIKLVMDGTTYSIDNERNGEHYKLDKSDMDNDKPCYINVDENGKALKIDLEDKPIQTNTSNELISKNDFLKTIIQRYTKCSYNHTDRKSPLSEVKWPSSRFHYLTSVQTVTVRSVPNNHTDRQSDRQCIPHNYTDRQSNRFHYLTENRQNILMA